MKAGALHPLEGAARPRVLLVDDKNDYLEALATLLAGEGYDVVTSTSAAEALVRAGDSRRRC
jgi:CheY-like chemotaxis protein